MPGIEEELARNAASISPMVPVFLNEEETTCFYHGCSNEIIWPLFHDLQSRCRFDPGYWEVYCQATEKFADAVQAVATRDDMVWVHDYHLMLLCDVIRDRSLPLRMAYFHHIPFPPPDIFEKLPWRREVLRGLLQYEAVGFQTHRDRRNFIDSVRRCLRDVHVRRVRDRLIVQAEELGAAVGVYPISIDFDEMCTAAGNPAVVAKAVELRKCFGAARVVLGVDRLDYTKGIPERLQAFRALIRQGLKGEAVLIQVVVPSREEIPKYAELKLEVEQLASQINGEFGAPGWMPIHYLHRSLSRDDLLAYYRAADVALITPLKDGMNLVAKEFCAARIDERGVLVLSEFAGAASELGRGALLVNPYDIDGVANALRKALVMSEREQEVRMHHMREGIQQRDVHAWSRAFCGQMPSRLQPKQVLDAGGRTLSAGAV
jgi:trehalose 6-phosphate synthase